MKSSKKTKQSSVFARLTCFMGRKQYLLYVSFFFSAVSAVLSLLPFVFIWQIMRSVLRPDEVLLRSDVATYAWLAAGTLVAGIVIYFLALLCSHIAAFRVEIGMQKVGLARVMRMPAGYHDLKESGRIRKVISDGARSTHSFLAHQLPDLAGSVLSPLLLLIALFVFDWRMGLACLIPMLLSFALFGRMMSPENRAFQDAYFRQLDRMSSESVEYVRGIPVVKTFGQTVKAFTRFYKSIIDYRDGVVAYTLGFRRHMVAFTAISNSAVFLLIPLAILLIERGEPLAVVMADFLLYLMLAPLFSGLVMRSAYFTQNLNMARQSIDRFDAIVDYPTMAKGTATDIPAATDLVFSNVTFTYPGADRPAVRDLSFTVKEGQTVALVGASGSGKTTAARLAARFWDVDEGAIRIGGLNVKDYPKDILMDKVAFVFQNSRLLKRTIRENITFGRKDVSDDEIKRAIHLAQADDIVGKLPRGLDTVYGTKGTWLSGGEQQRIALARAFLKDAPIVLLDEATAFADPENERMIRRALKTLGRGRTCLMIAHRLSTVRDADCILVMDRGTVVERGTHDELLRQDGPYAVMWREYERSVSWSIQGTTAKKEALS